RLDRRHDVAHELLERVVDHLQLGRHLPRVVSDRGDQVRLAEPRRAVDEERVVRLARRVRNAPRRRRRQTIRRADDEGVEGEARVQLDRAHGPAVRCWGGASGCWNLRDRFRSTSSLILRSVSKTPSPETALAVNDGTPRKLSRSSSSSTGTTPGRSRLLYWSTSGSSRMSKPSSRRFSWRLRRLSRFSSICSRCESATKTTPSAPRNTSLRVAL